MQQPPYGPDTMFDDLLQDLPPEVERFARECKAFTRARKIKTPSQLLRLVFLYCGLDKSLRDVAGETTLLVERITDTSIRARLTACGPWIQAMLAAMLPATQPPPSSAGGRLLVVDGRQVEAPGATGTDDRRHVCLDVTHMQFVRIVVTDKHTGESCAHFPLGRGDLGLADRHYATAEAIVETVLGQADVLLRMSAQRLPVYQPEGARLDFRSALQGQPSATLRTWAVRVQSARHQRAVNGDVHAYGLDDEAANRARQRVRELSRKKGRPPKEMTLLLAGWVLVVTTVAPQTLPAHTIMALYRVRWQVALAIKRWKSVLDVDALRARAGSPLAEVWLRGKLLYAVLIERRAQRKLGDDWTRLDGERRATWWRAWKLCQDEVSVCILGGQLWREEEWVAWVKMLAERPRRRQLQRLPKEVVMINQGIIETPQEEPIAA